MAIGYTGVLTRTPSDDVLLNSDNLTPDQEDSTLRFSRGTEDPDAIIKWDSINKRFVFNFPIESNGQILNPDDFEDIINDIFEDLREEIREVDESYVWQRDLIGAQDGINSVFTLIEKFNSDQIKIFKNGQRLTKSEDFSVAESIPSEGYDTLIFYEAPEVSDIVYADYKKS